MRDFLVTRRARITPRQAGLTFYGGNRRVPGLRREEVAMLADVSADYYTRLEKGNLTGVSDSVLEAIAGALQLDEAERLHLLDLARAANTSPARAARRMVPQQLRPSTKLILDGMTDTPAFVRNGRLDILAANTLGRALYAPAFSVPGRDVNLARFRFLDPAAHDVRLHRSGRKHFRHPAIGLLDLTFETMALEADEGLTLTAYTAEPGTPSHDGLKLLASWAATSQRQDSGTRPA